MDQPECVGIFETCRLKFMYTHKIAEFFIERGQLTMTCSLCFFYIAVKFGVPA